jgi:Flp pilus assembly protein TadD
MPVISANTNARAEGYFRLEWKLAVDRSHLMADDQPFLFPIVIDDTAEPTARVPDRFREVQWTRLDVKDTPESLAGRVQRLLAGNAEPVRPRPAPTSANRETTAPAPTRGWVRNLSIVGGLLIGLVYALRTPFGHFFPPERKAPPVASTPAVSEGIKLAQQARTLYDKVGFGRDDLVLADDLAKRATDLEPTAAFAWGVRAHVQAAFLFRGFAVGDEFVHRARDAQSFANRAVALQADEAEALLAQGRVATYQRAYGQAEEIFGRALAAHPGDNRIRRALGTLLRYQPKRLPEALSVLQEAVRRNPQDALAHYDLAMGWRDAWHFRNSWAECDAALALQQFGSPLTQQASLALAWKGDVALMRTLLDRLSPADQNQDRFVYFAMLCGVLERNAERTAATAQLTTRDYLEDSAFEGPKAWFVALAYQRAGKENLARAQWQAAEAFLRERIRLDPRSQNYRMHLALTLAWLGRGKEATDEVAPIEAVWREQMTPFRAARLARHYAALGDASQAVAFLRQAVNRQVQYTDQEMRLDPFLDRVRDTPEFAALLAAIPPPPAPVEPAPYLGKTTAAAPREVDRMIADVYATLQRLSYTRENLAIAEETTRKATELAPESARTWAARARVHAAYLQRLWDSSAKRRQDTQAAADRALAIDPDNADAMIAQSQITGRTQAQALLRRAIELRPADPVPRRLLASSLAGQGRSQEALEMRSETVRLFPNDALAHYDLALQHMGTGTPELALAGFDAAVAIEPFASAFINKAQVLIADRGDLAGARRALDQISPADRTEDRAVGVSLWLALLAKDEPHFNSAAALSARTYLEDALFEGPKSWLLAHGLRRSGKDTLARLQWEEAESIMRARLQARPGDLLTKLQHAVTLAWLERTDGLAAHAATVDGAARESTTWPVRQAAARFHAGRGDAAQAVFYLRQVVNTRNHLADRTLPLDPWWDKLRGQPEFEALLAEARARVEKQ